MRYYEREMASRCKLDPKVQRVSKERRLWGAQLRATGLPSESLGPTLCKCEESSAISQVSESQPLSMASEPLRGEDDTQRNFTTGSPIKGPQPKYGAFKVKRNPTRVAQRPRSEKLCEAIVFVMDLEGGAALHEVSEADSVALSSFLCVDKIGQHWTPLGNKSDSRRWKDQGDVRLMCGSHGRCFCRQPERHILGNQSGSS